MKRPAEAHVLGKNVSAVVKANTEWKTIPKVDLANGKEMCGALVRT